MPDREARFEVIGDVLTELLVRPDPLIVDLGVGPGTPADAGDYIAFLRAAGFAEAGTVWQYGDDRVVVGIR